MNKIPELVHLFGFLLLLLLGQIRRMEAVGSCLSLMYSQTPILCEAGPGQQQNDKPSAHAQSFPSRP
jgi:hypothetical protein